MAEKQGYNRRDFLKIIGATTGIAAAGCAKEVPEKLIPYVIQPDEVVPGVATWYAGSCGECGAGCGVLVRTREGRVLKVEGNPAHPINRGALCALGQSTVQGHYDPDRIREPLKRDVNGAFKPVSWQEALDAVADAVKAASTTNKKTVLLTNPLSGSALTLTREFLGKVPGSEHLQYSLLNEDALQVASRETFGDGVEVHFDFSKPRVIVGFGADYLGTWVSPVEFTKGFSKGRVPGPDGSISKVFHIEPRLSLTAANADQWLMNAPRTESDIMLALLKLLFERGRDKLKEGGQVQDVLPDTSPADLLKDTGVSPRQLEAIADALLKAPSSLVVAGGPATSGPQAVRAARLALLINVALGNVGETVVLRPTQNGAAKTSQEVITELTKRMAAEANDVGVLVLANVNPVFGLPGKAGFTEAVTKVGMVVALATNLDETSRLAQVVLPLSTTFESWSDAEPAPGVFNLNQPAMQPLYKTQSYGDTLIALAANQKLNVPFEGMGSYWDYIRAQWKKRIGEANFEDRWLELVQAGGDWSSPVPPRSSASLAANAAKIPAMERPKAEGLQLLTYPTVHFADGSSANRPWMQEIPDPLVGAVWGSWVEAHPSVLEQHGLKQGDLAQIVTPEGTIEAPLYASKRIYPGLLAVPLGQGHSSLGRYSNGVGTNPLRIYPADGGQTFNFIRSGVTLRRSIARDELVLSQGSDTEYDRGFARTISAAALKKHLENGHKHGHGSQPAHTGEHGAGHGGDSSAHAAGDSHGVPAPYVLHPHDPHALGPREEPKQMYHQMEHVLYRWGMTIDVAACTGCTACVTACYAENNVPVVGKEFFSQGREMSWIRINRFFDGPEEQPVTGFVPMLCQHCGNAPCEPVCPVYATYHNEEGLNSMVYNRCVGTRYCSNNCTYKVRRFNWFEYTWPEPLNWQLNPDITTRGMGVMEKCTFCVQRIREAQNIAKNEGRQVEDGEIQPACAATCPADAIKFGNLLDKESEVYKHSQDPRSYKILDVEVNTQPAISYLAKVTHRPGNVE